LSRSHQKSLQQTDETVVQLLDVVLLHSGPRGLGQRKPLLGVICQVTNRPHDSRRVPLGDEVSGYTILDQLGNSAVIGTDDWYTHSHALAWIRRTTSPTLPPRSRKLEWVPGAIE
jgi:hypothetical protein